MSPGADVLLLALLLLSTLAFLDFSLVALRVRGVLDFSHPLSIVAAGLFFVSGPASWLAAARLGGKEAKLTLVALPAWGSLAALYAAIITSLLESGLPSSVAGIVVLPAGLVVALIGFLEMIVDYEVRGKLTSLYVRCGLGLPPYALVTLSSITAVLALIARNPASLAAGLAIYGVGVAAYARCTSIERSACHISSALIAAMLAATLVVLAGGDTTRAALAGVATAAPIAAVVAARRHTLSSEWCTLILLGFASTSVLVAGITSGVNPASLEENLAVFLTVGGVGWTASLAAVAAARLRPELVARIANARETRMAAGLALVMIGLRALGLPEGYLTLALFTVGIAAALVNEEGGMDKRRRGL